MSARPTADVIVVGGGVIGCAVAYFLAAEHGVRSLIFERNAIASEASGGAAGELAGAELAEVVGWHRPSASYTRFLLEGIELHTRVAPAIIEESGIDYMLSDLPMLRPAFDEAEAEQGMAQLEEHRASGVWGEWLDAGEVRAVGSWLSDDAVGAEYSVEHQLEAYPFAVALAQAAEHHGVEIRTGEITGIERSGGCARGVRVHNETVEADAVVIANGPWAKFAGEWMGIDVPVIPLRGQIVHMNLPPGVTAPRHAIFHSSGYVLPKTGGDLLVGTTMEEAGFDRESTVEARDAILEAAVRLAPALIDAPIREVSACLRPYSLDDRPLIGPVPGWESLYLATGHGFKGITLALITGKLLAQIIAGASVGFPMDELSPSRLVRR